MNILFWKKWPFLFKFRAFLGLIIVILVSLVFYLKIVPGGEITYSRDYRAGGFWRGEFLGKGFVGNFSPADRIDKTFTEGERLIGDPIYFSVATPRTFDKAKVTVVYKNNLQIDTPLIEAGVLVDKVVWRYDLKPLSNKTLDYLSLRAFKIEENGLLFLQANNNYSSWSAFQADLNKGQVKDCYRASDNCLAVYNYDPEYTYRLANYQRATPVVVDKVLRGAHQFYVYLDKENLHLKFDFIDLNTSLQASPIEVILSLGGEIIATQKLEDANLFPGSEEAEKRTLILEKNNLPAGAYKVEVKISDDVLIEKIASSLNRLAFINKVHLAEHDGPLSLYTDSRYLQVKILNPASRQTIIFGDDNFLLEDAYRQIDLQTLSGVQAKEIKLEKGNIILENNGVFAWQAPSLFNPTLTKIDRFFSVADNPAYVIANYNKPVEREGVTTATAEFNLRSAYREKGKYSFMISVPGLKAEDNIYDNLEVYSVKIEFSGRTLWQKLTNSR